MFEKLYAELRSGGDMSFELDQGAVIEVDGFAIMESWGLERETRRRLR